MDIQKPVTITTPDGIELTKNKTAQGNIVGDGTTDRVLIGFQKDGFGDGKDFGMKVSQEGVDVKTAAEDELVMSSGFNQFKIAKVMDVSTTINYNSGNQNTWFSTSSTAHGLGYAPAYVAFITIPSAIAGGGALAATNLPNPALVYGTAAGTVIVVFVGQVSADSTNVVIAGQIGMTIANANYVISAKIYLLKETQ